MRDLYLDVNKGYGDWARKIIVGCPYVSGQGTFYSGVSERVEHTKSYSPEYQTKLLMKREVV